MRAREGTDCDSKAEAEAMSTPTAPLLSLKGIVNTNVDPNLCALCSVPLTGPRNDSDNPWISICCGKHTCSTCYDSERPTTKKLTGASYATLPKSAESA